MASCEGSRRKCAPFEVWAEPSRNQAISHATGSSQFSALAARRFKHRAWRLQAMIQRLWDLAGFRRDTNTSSLTRTWPSKTSSGTFSRLARAYLASASSEEDDDDEDSLDGDVPEVLPASTEDPTTPSSSVAAITTG